ncbi:MAG TPA: class I SAM-dependent methyltransferase [Candidatus Acidoferrales bacterium]|nr:class I SAM-dependent methyltransferase [Candidatus Acidoferrales bacterium]
MSQANVNLWQSPEHALDYLRCADSIPHRVEGEATLLEFLPADAHRVLDLGSGGGRLLSLVRASRPRAEFVALDFSPAMLEALSARFAGDPSIAVVAHDLEKTLPELGRFDVVVSSFAIHHVPHARKRSLYKEIFEILVPGGVFCNLEHVASPTPRLHAGFLKAIACDEEDPSNKLLDMETQLAWLREIGFIEVDCHWKWRELALLAGQKPV